MIKLMILGAGISQLPLIQKAKEMGLYVIVVSRMGNYPGFAIADKIYDVDTTLSDEVVEIAMLEGIHGICTTGTDVAVKAIGKAVDRMGLNGISYRSAQLSTNKWDMKKAFEQYGVRTSRFIKVKNREEAHLAFERLKPPLIFKALDSGASKGIVKVEHRSQVGYALEEVKKATKLDYLIVEEFVEGVEFGAQAFVYDSEIQFIMPHGDRMFYGNAGVPIGHYVPFPMDSELLADLHTQLERSIRALQLNNCAINADFIIKGGREIYVLEIGGRAGATCLPELVSTYYGFDYYEQMIRAALRMNPMFQLKGSQPCACELLLSDSNGEIVSIVNRNGEQENILQLSFDYQCGDRINKFQVGTDRIGHIIIKGDQLEKVLEQLDEVKSRIHITLKE